MANKYNWKRFWCPRNGAIDLSDNGFLSDPEGEYFEYTHSDIIAVDKISSKHCLVFLGEPGIGKSTAIIDEKEAMSSDNKIFFLNLNDYGNETRLINDIFKSEDFTAWINSDYTLHLFLDSLDECRIQIPKVGILLSNQFEKIKEHLHRLNLRIACRTADWPSVLDNSLPLLWKKEEYGVYELAPLRRKDVRNAAEINNIDPDAFIEGLINSELIPLAIKPITLEFLIDTYKQEKKFPSSKIELYNRGCKKLCEENNPNRRDLTIEDSLTNEPKFSIAKKVAAVSIFCKKPILYEGTTTHLNNDEINISELVSSGISLPNIKEVIKTGLFSGRGSQKFGFAHQTYAEFLAAFFIKENIFELEQIEAIVFSSIGSERKAVPQLYETAAWLACMNKELFNSIARNDPQVPLRGDADTYLDKEKEFLVNSIMDLLSRHKINIRDWGICHTYQKLKHPGLPGQLKPFIVDKTKNWNVRYEAILIAEKCNLTDLGDVLADIALDNTDHSTIRSLAAGALAEIGNAECRKRLMPFVLGQEDAGQDEQLKGDALSALWPDLIDAKTLFDNLTLPKKDYFHGSYESFLSSELVKKLKPKDIPIALKWLEGMISQRKLPFVIERVSDDLIILAWKNIDEPEVANALAKVCAAFSRHYHGMIHNSDKLKENEALFNEIDKRRLIVDTIVNKCEDFEKIDYGFLSGPPRIAGNSDDIFWLLEKFKKAESEIYARRWAKLILYTYNCENPEHCKEIVEVAASSAILSEALYLNPIELNSEKAIKLKESYQDAMKWQQKAKHKPRKLKPPPVERIQNCLQEIDKGKINFWVSLSFELTLEDTSEQYESDKCCRLDITELPGWINSDSDTRNRIITAADKFLRDKAADSLKWIQEPDTWKPSDIAPNKAFCLLKKEASFRYQEIPAEIWSKWTYAILGMPLFNDDNKQEGYELVKTAYEKCPDTFIPALELQIDAESEKASHVTVHEKLEFCLDLRLCNVILNKIIQPSFKRGQFHSFRNLLACLVKRKYQPAIEFTQTLIRQEWPKDDESRQKMCDAAIVLMENTDDASWSIIWPAINACPEFGRELLQEWADEGTHSRIMDISDNSLADLYIWLEREFPHSEDPPHDEEIGERHHIAYFRDNILRALENIGTVESCNAIKRIANEFPALDWLKSILVEAKKNTIRKNWQPPTPEQLLDMASRNTRLVRNGDELQDAVIESLGRLGKELQGENTPVQFLWDTRAWMPKEEAALSDFVAGFLKKDLKQFGIAALREVEIRRKVGGKPGEHTDIYVTVCVPNSLSGQDERITIIVEAKGCWNEGLSSDMKDQLVDRYLKDIQCNHGIYLVGWFACSQCKYDNCKTKICQKGTIDDLRNQLDSQAKLLSINDLKIKSFVINAALR
jgi:hypothetical protein